MSSESVCQVAHSWVDVGSFHTRLFGIVYMTCGDFTMDQRKEQRVCIKFCANLGKIATETLTVIQQAFRDHSLSCAQVFQWHARFKTGRISVDDDKHTGRSTSCTTPEAVARIQELVHQDRRQTIHNIAEEVGIGYGTCQRVLTQELGMHRVAAKFVPRILTADRSSSVSTSVLNWTELKNKMAFIPHSPYSPDLAPCDFFLFPKMKLKLKGCQLVPLRRYRPNRRECLTLIEKDFQEPFQKWRRQWDIYVESRLFTSHSLEPECQPYL